jgi:hypothetical protein
MYMQAQDAAAGRTRRGAVTVDLRKLRTSRSPPCQKRPPAWPRAPNEFHNFRVRAKPLDPHILTIAAGMNRARCAGRVSGASLEVDHQPLSVLNWKH